MMKRFLTLLPLLAALSFVTIAGCGASRVSAGPGCNKMKHCSTMRNMSGMSKCTADCCCMKKNADCCKKCADCDCACCKKNGCCEMAKSSCGMKKPCEKPCCKKSGDTESAAPTASPEASLDPVCGMDVEVEGAKYNSEYNGKTYYFCNETCKERFDKDPSKFIGK